MNYHWWLSGIELLELEGKGNDNNINCKIKFVQSKGTTPDAYHLP